MSDKAKTKKAEKSVIKGAPTGDGTGGTKDTSQAPATGADQAPLPPLKPPPLEDVLVGFAEQVKAHFADIEVQIQVLCANVASLIVRVGALETAPHGDVAATIEALGKILQPVLARLGNTTPVADLNQLKQMLRPGALTVNPDPAPAREEPKNPPAGPAPSSKTS